ncbi:hypothetical protein [Candidatus Nitrospira inopinata]|jgi:hypothetical protein|uniref:Outer membrane protein beta-barrel domain-containing protein n=1 Tax=Candidatus Nitrospira inopinata TaxID=1715989 RepID=A0A0S4KKQ8_9BACT|nr:hypothetical protein [Candidatus Nitrospira inopinata]CUQ65009.1 conserved exported protein of unknown function [Candidatus Nitrospira inopinata]
MTTSGEPLRHSHRFPPRLAVCLLGMVLLSMPFPSLAMALDSTLELLPLRPFNFDISFNQRTFAPRARVIAAQAGITALRYGLIEVRTVYQFYSQHTKTFVTDQHSLYLNPRWNNFIDILDFPQDKPIHRLLRHILFGPLEDRAVPYVGALLGGTLPGRGEFSPGYLYGGQIGVRFPVAKGFSVDMGLQYSRFEIDFQSKSNLTEQWLFTIGVRF